MKAAIGAGLVSIVLCSPALRGADAADAAHPYSNINRGVDAGNNTGDAQTDQLNAQELQRVAPPSEQGGQAPGQATPGRPYPYGATGGTVSGSRPYPYSYPYAAPYPYPHPPGPPPYGYPPPVYPYGVYPLGWRPWWGYRPWFGRPYYYRW